MEAPSSSIIQPGYFKLPRLEKEVYLFFILNHFYQFHDMVKGANVSSFGPAKRFDFEKNGQQCSALGGFIGAPLAVIIVENAMVSGATTFYSFGTAGSIGNAAIEIGEQHLPQKGYDRTGMILDYGGEKPETDFQLDESRFTCNAIVSVNSFYRLTPERLEEYRSNKIDLIDMEAAPLNYVIQSKGATFYPTFIVSDKVNDEYKWHYEKNTSRFKSAIENGLASLLTEITNNTRP